MVMIVIVIPFAFCDPFCEAEPRSVIVERH